MKGDSKPLNRLAKNELNNLANEHELELLLSVLQTWLDGLGAYATGEDYVSVVQMRAHVEHSIDYWTKDKGTLPLVTVQEVLAFLQSGTCTKIDHYDWWIEHPNSHEVLTLDVESGTPQFAIIDDFYEKDKAK